MSDANPANQKANEPGKNPAEKNAEPIEAKGARVEKGDSNAAEARAEPSDPVKDELAVARKRVDELARAYQACEKDREEFKLRIQRERERMLDVEKADIALTLIETIDELDLSLQAADESPLREGVKLIRENVLRKLSSKQIERLEPLGDEYDPRVAEAVDTELTADPDEDGRIVEVLRAGYRMKDRVIRAARVKVARYVKPAQA
jgi:molecular chaperone GrpE